MTFIVEAVYESGMLKLLQPLPIPEGEQVEVTIVLQRPEAKKTPAEILARIAALPSEHSTSENFSGAEHDAILYVEK
ncbi:MAG TPA: antitoxin family protein [Leptolyngbya sp.]|jgi:predicted DNA-binding antitoxin AbrB/MazE fold protein|nr:antitoxin family protein [Leptolyngbya sp.]